MPRRIKPKVIDPNLNHRTIKTISILNHIKKLKLEVEELKKRQDMKDAYKKYALRELNLKIEEFERKL